MKTVNRKPLKLNPLPYLVCFFISTAQSNADWKFFRGTPDMKGVADAELNLPLKLEWSIKIGRSVFATPVISGDKVFIGNEEGRFVCLSLTEGNILWEFNTDDIIEGTACVAKDSVLFGSGDGHLYSLNTSDGKLKWKYETEGEILGGANLFKSTVDQKLYVLVGSYDNYMHCVALSNGKLKWKYETQNYVNGAP